MVSCAINGLGLALVIPCVQSLVADYHPSESRGKAFGFMFFTASCGMLRHTTLTTVCVCAKTTVVPLRSLDLCSFIAPFQSHALKTVSTACDMPACTYHQTRCTHLTRFDMENRMCAAHICIGHITTISGTDAHLLYSRWHDWRIFCYQHWLHNALWNGRLALCLPPNGTCQPRHQWSCFLHCH
jgi:hypothetical protein